MKRNIVWIIALLALALTATDAQAVKSKGGGGGGGTSEGGAMSVQVREVVVRTTANYMGAAAGTLTYGAQVNVTGEQGNWYQIDKPAGYIPQSTVKKGKVAVNADEKFAGKGAKDDEVALAGKGFGKIETQFRGGHPELSSAYSEVDRIDKIAISDAALRQFQSAGKLKAR